MPKDDKSPAFQFYPKDFLTDENVQLMTNEEIGCYWRLVCHCWLEGSIPSDVNKIARLCKVDGKNMAELWLAIKPCFILLPGDESRLIHPRLEKERAKQEDHKKERATAGRMGAKARWNKDLSSDSSAIAQPCDSYSSANDQPMAKNASSSPSTILKKVSTNVDTKENEVEVERKTTKGTRIPENWIPSPEEFAYAKSHLTQYDERKIITEVERFRNYWESKSGKDATKISWGKTWMNWVLSAKERMETTKGKNFYDKREDAARDFLTPLDELLRRDRETQAGGDSGGEIIDITSFAKSMD